MGESNQYMAGQLQTGDSQSSTPLSHFNVEIHRNMVQSQIEGGVLLADLATGVELNVQTANRSYTMVNRGGGRVLISGHPEFCPEPVEVSIHGSTWGGAMIRTGFIGRGMHLEFGHPTGEGRIITSPIIEVEEKR